MASVTITRTDFTSAELRVEARRTEDTKQTRRLLAIAMVLDGVPRAMAAETCAMDRQTLRDWVHRFNAEGISGLSDRLRPGRPSSLSAAQQAEVANWVEAGPDLEKDGVVRWRRADLCERIKVSFGIALDVRTWASCCTNSNLAAFRPGRSIQRAMKRRSRLLKNVWPAPSASDFCDPIRAVCVNVSGLWA